MVSIGRNRGRRNQGDSQERRARSYGISVYDVGKQTVGKPPTEPDTRDGDALPLADEEATDARNGPSLKEQVEAFERGLVARALDGTGGNQSEAARRLGVSRVTLIDKMKKYGLSSKR